MSDTAATDTHPNSAVQLKREHALGIIELHQPAKSNALTFEMWGQLGDLLQEAAADDSIRVLVIRGAGGANFSAGADISEFAERRATVNGARTYGKRTAEAEHRLYEFPKPTIAVIRGACVGGGCELAVACDFRFCDTSARFALTPTRLGIVYAPEATRRLVTLVGLGWAKSLLMTARTIDADEALRLGLVMRVLPPSDLDAEVAAFVGYLELLSPVALRGTKKVMHLIADAWPEGAAEAREIVDRAVGSSDYREGILAFIERRTPRFAP